VQSRSVAVLGGSRHQRERAPQRKRDGTRERAQKTNMAVFMSGERRKRGEKQVKVSVGGKKRKKSRAEALPRSFCESEGSTTLDHEERRNRMADGRE